MKALGICLQKNCVRVATLEGTKTAPALLASRRLITTDPDNVPELMNWFDTQFRQLITEFNPTVIAYKLSLELDLKQQHYLSFPLGLLNYIAMQQSIDIKEYSSKGITPKKLGHPKGTDIYAMVNTIFGMHPPYWDKYQQESILVAWFCL